MEEFKKAIVKVTMDFNNQNFKEREQEKTFIQDEQKIKDCMSNGLSYNFANGGQKKEEKFGPNNRLVTKFEKKGGFFFKDLTYQK